MRYKIFLILIFCSLFSTKSLSQNKCKIFGWVLDSLSKSPISNVNVIIQGTNVGTATDTSGYFLLYLPTGKEYTIVFSHIAYNKSLRELSLEKYKEVEYRIYMQKRKIELNNVIVQDKKSFDDKRALYTVNGSELEKLGEKDLEKKLIYLLPDVVHPLIDRVNNENYDFTLYINGKWVNSIYLKDINPSKIKYIKVWRRKKLAGIDKNKLKSNIDKMWVGIDTNPTNLPLIVGNFVMLIVTK